MQSTVLTRPDVADADTLERRRPGRFDDVSIELIPLLRGDVPAATEASAAATSSQADEAAISARDPVAERQAAFKIVMIIVSLAALVMLFGK